MRFQRRPSDIAGRGMAECAWVTSHGGWLCVEKEVPQMSALDTCSAPGLRSCSCSGRVLNTILALSQVRSHNCWRRFRPIARQAARRPGCSLAWQSAGQ
jgi:hypothetical protein